MQQLASLNYNVSIWTCVTWASIRAPALGPTNVRGELIRSTCRYPDNRKCFFILARKLMASFLQEALEGT